MDIGPQEDKYIEQLNNYCIKANLVLQYTRSKNVINLSDNIDKYQNCFLLFILRVKIIVYFENALGIFCTTQKSQLKIIRGLVYKLYN